MSDESCYYSPGEAVESEKENNVSHLARNLMSEFQDEVKTIPDKNTDNREPIKVYLRIRPFSQDEMKASEDQGCLQILDDKTVLLSAPRDSFTFKSSIRGVAEQSHQFSFSKIYDENVSQKDIFDDTMLGYVKDFMDGINCLIFTYGVTNSGKTFTIQGNPKNGGILPRALDVLFNSIKGRQYEHMNLKPTMYQDVSSLDQGKQHFEEVLKKAVLNAGEKHDIDLSILWKMDTTAQNDTSSISATSTASSSYITANEDVDYSTISDELKERVCDGTVIDIKSQGPVKFSVWVSFAEIYNEYVYDLLDPTPLARGKKRPTLKLGDDKNGNPYIKGLREIQVNSADEAFKILKVGQKNQNFAATKLNQNSSRSHSIFTIKTLRVVDVDNPHVARISRLSFVDLAGSERYCKTQSTGSRLKEASNINTSIMTLGKCIEYLRYNQQHKNHPVIIPFRENKLTRLFQGFFVGKGKACMVVNVSQCASVFDETYNVLKFSSVAKQVTTKGVRNTEMFKPKLPPKPQIPSVTQPKKLGRHTLFSVGFATPRTIGKEAMRESMYDNADEDDCIQALVKSYETLRKQLIDERRKNAMMELKIREEVCAEMSEQIVEIERNYNERLQEEQETMEEMCERRMKMLTKSMKIARKKRKLERLPSEDDVPDGLLQAEKTKVKERDETIRTLRAKLAEKEIAHEFYKQTQTAEEHPEVIERLQSELDEAKETVKVNEAHIEDLQTTLNYTQDVLEERLLEIEKLKEVVDLTDSKDELVELKVLLEETSKALNEARLKLDARDEKLKQKDAAILQLSEQLRALQETNVDKTEMEELWREVAQLQEEGGLLRERYDFQSKELSELRQEKKDVDSQKKLLSNRVEELERQLAESEDRREQQVFKGEEQDKKIKRFADIVSNQETALAESEAIIEQLNEKVEILTAKRATEADVEVQREEEMSNSEDSEDSEDEVVLKLPPTEVVTVNVNEKGAPAVERFDLEREIEELKEKVKGLEKELLARNQELSNQRDEYETELKASSEKIDEALRECVVKGAEIQRLKKNHSDELKSQEEGFDIRKKGMKKKFDEFEEEIKSLKTELEKKGGVTNAKKPCVKKPVDLKKKAIDVSSKYGGPVKVSAMTGMKSKPRPASVVRVATASPRSPCKPSQPALRVLERTLKETSDALDKKNEQVIAKNRTIAELRDRVAELEDLRAESLGVKTRLEEVTNEAKNFELQVADLRLKVERANGEIAVKDNEGLENQRELSTLQKEAEVFKEEKYLLEETVEKSRLKIKELEDLFNEVKLKKEHSENELTKLMSAQEASLNEITHLREQLSQIQNELLVKNKEIVSLNESVAKFHEMEQNYATFLSEKQKHADDMAKKLREYDELKSRHEALVTRLNSEITGLQAEQGILMDQLESKNSDLRSKVIELNKAIEENVQLKNSLCEAEKNYSLLELQVKLRGAERELDTMHTRQQVASALAKASKKEERRINDMTEMMAERDEIMEQQKEQIKDKQLEIDDLVLKLEEAKSLEKELVKKQQAIQELRWSVIKKDEKIKELNSLEDKVSDLEKQLKEFDEIKFQKETLTMQFETQKRTIKEREQQLSSLTNKLEELMQNKLNADLCREDDAEGSVFAKETPGSEYRSKNIGDTPLAALRECNSDKKSPIRLRKSARIKVSSLRKDKNQENTPQTTGSMKKKESERKVLFDLEEGKPDDVRADTHSVVQPEKKRRRKLLAKNTGICAESPQVIPPSPVKDDEVTLIVKRQLRSSTRR